VKIGRLDLLEAVPVVIGKIHLPFGRGLFDQPPVAVIVVEDLLPPLVGEGL
jgi:hypothetical protein